LKGGDKIFFKAGRRYFLLANWHLPLRDPASDIAVTIDGFNRKNQKSLFNNLFKKEVSSINVLSVLKFLTMFHDFFPSLVLLFVNKVRID
jgi:hypothetical protein